MMITRIEPDLTKYGRYTDEEAYREFFFVGETDGNGVLHWYDEQTKTDVTVSYSTEVGAYAADIYVNCEYMGAGFGETPYEALLKAVIDAEGYKVLKENPNMEDSMNILCYGTFEILYGDIFKSRSREIQYDGRSTSEVLNALWKYAAEFVKEHCRNYGFEFDMSWAI